MTPSINSNIINGTIQHQTVKLEHAIRLGLQPLTTQTLHLPLPHRLTRHAHHRTHPLTQLKDLKSVWYKMRYVILLLPQHKDQATNELKHWDLWGPLIICLFFSITLSLVSSNDRI